MSHVEEDPPTGGDPNGGDPNGGDPTGGGPSALNFAQQMKDMEKLMDLQLQTMRMQMQRGVTSQVHNALAKQVQVPEGKYSMSLSEFRTYRKDCTDFQKLTGYTDQQVVLQMRMKMDNDLKRVIDTNLKSSWDSLTVEGALNELQSIVQQVSNTAVYRKEFDEMIQSPDEKISEYATKLRSCALDCNFVCPYDASHDLTDYHLINRIRAGVSDKKLQQELLVKSDSVDTVTSIITLCEHYETAKKDSKRLAGSNTPGISNLNVEEEVDLDDVSEEEMIAAISSYRKNKSRPNLNTGNDKKNKSKEKECTACGYVHQPQG